MQCGPGVHSWCRLCATSAWWRCCTHEMCAWVTLSPCSQHHFQCVGRLGVQTLPRNTEDSFVLAMEHFQFGNSSLLALCTTAGEIEGWDLRAPTQVAQIHTITSMNCCFSGMEPQSTPGEWCTHITLCFTSQAASHALMLLSLSTSATWQVLGLCWFIERLFAVLGP